METKNVGLFHACYRISNHLQGGVELNINVLVDTVNKRVSGIARISQAINPPLNITSELQGDYNYMCTMESCRILVVAEGADPFQPLIHGVPQIHKNLTLRIVLDEDWQKGVANYNYCINGAWHEISQARVEIVTNHDCHNINKLASVVKENEKEPVA